MLQAPRYARAASIDRMTSDPQPRRRSAKCAARWIHAVVRRAERYHRSIALPEAQLCRDNLDENGAAIRMRSRQPRRHDDRAEPGPAQALFEGSDLWLPCVNRNRAEQAAGPAMSAMPR